MNAILIATLVLLADTPGSGRQDSPRAVLQPAPHLEFPAPTDSNSPVFWDERGLNVINSLHAPFLSSGWRLNRLGDTVGVQFLPGTGAMPEPWWIESVIRAGDGTLYGYYHHEPIGVCARSTKTAPVIGAIRSTDGGLRWQDLGVILNAPRDTLSCVSENAYFVGGEGDVSAVLDEAGEHVYFFFSSYRRDPQVQGVGVARLAWKDRDAPRGAARRWTGSGWTGAGNGGDMVPLFGVSASWHGPLADAFWGPSVHWNTHLRQYVMLLNRTEGPAWNSEGIYVAYADRLDDPRAWSAPVKIVDGGAWYPQVVGLRPGEGGDTRAGKLARFYMAGVSDHFIEFFRPDE